MPVLGKPQASKASQAELQYVWELMRLNIVSHQAAKSTVHGGLDVSFFANCIQIDDVPLSLQLIPAGGTTSFRCVFEVSTAET